MGKKIEDIEILKISRNKQEKGCIFKKNGKVLRICKKNSTFAAKLRILLYF